MSSDRFERVKELAGEAYRHLEFRDRPDGSRFVTTKDDAPDWVRDLCFAAHDDGDWLPDDQRYQMLLDALGFIKYDAAESAHDLGELSDKSENEFRDDVDVYTDRLGAWLASSVRRVGYLDEVFSEYGGDIDDGARLLMLAQSFERRDVLHAVWSFLSEKTTEEEEIL